MSSDFKGSIEPTFEGICEYLQGGKPLKEINFPRVELKSEWTVKHGEDISAIANHESMKGGWLLVGVSDDGKLIGKTEKWAESTEKTISNQINEFLSPFTAVKEVYVKGFPQGYCIILDVINPGDVTDWKGKAYKVTGTSSTEMKPEEKIKLTLSLPGEDYTKQPWEGNVDSSLVLKFAQKVQSLLPTEFPDKLENLSPNQILQIFHLKNITAGRILFGDTLVRIAYYDENEDLLDSQAKQGAYNILSDDFISGVQHWTRKQAQSVQGTSTSAIEEMPYPSEALREVFANAVAHALYQRNQGEIIVDLFPDRLLIRNNAVIEAKAFSKQWFARQTHVKNKLLMSTLRVAKISDELGSGKMKVFRLMLEGAKREPIIEFTDLGEYGKWKITLYNHEQDHYFKNLLQRFYDTFPARNHARIAAALVLWNESTWSEVQEKLDEHYKKVALEVIRNDNSPVIVIDNKLLLKRWANIALTGQTTKTFSLAEENTIFEALLAYSFQNMQEGLIATHEARKLIGLSDTKSETTQLSNLFRKWKKDTKVEQLRRGQWRFLVRPQRSLGLLTSKFEPEENANRT